MKACNFITKILQHRCFSLNLVTFFYYVEHLLTVAFVFSNYSTFCHTFGTIPKITFKVRKITLHRKWSFPLQISSANVTKSAVVTFTEEICNGKLHFWGVVIILKLYNSEASTIKLWKLTETRLHYSKNEFPIKDFFSNCDQIRNFLGIWSH